MAGLLVGDIHDWVRVGRGRGLEFYVDDEEMAGILTESLLPAYGPYVLAGSLMIEEGKGKYVEEPFIRDIGEFLQLRREGVWEFFICSTAVTKDLNIRRGDRVSARLSLSGLVNLQQGALHKGRWCESSIGVVDRVVNRETGETVTHREYLQILNALKRSLKKLLCYPTVQTYKDGTRVRSRTVLMSRGLADKYCRGEVLPEALPDMQCPS